MWARDEVSSCNCSEKSYRHVHCQCLRWNRKATTRKTELRHWSEAGLCTEGASGTFGFNSSDEELVTDTFQMDINGEGTDSQELLEMDENPGVQNDVIVKDSDNCENANPLRKLVVKAVLEAVSLVDYSGASINAFEDILDYGKSILLELWPKNWKAVQSLLEE